MKIAGLPATDIGSAGALLAQAFRMDPVIGHLLSGRPRRRIAYPAFFRAAVRELYPRGHVYGAWEGDRLVGVASWLPPGTHQPAATARLRMLPDRLLVRAMWPTGLRRVEEGFAGLAAQHPIEPHWYLAFVGVEPDRQGQGIGARLLAPILAQADAEGMSCYLETPFRQTFPLYERLGFVHRTETRTFTDCPPVWTMLRPPAPTR